MKLLFVILDGIGDRPCEEFNGQTPLEAAKTPNLDKLAKLGKTGIMLIIDENTPPETDNGLLAIFGYDPNVYSRCRAVLEVIGEGLNFNEGDLAIRCNFATFKDGKIYDARAGRIKSSKSRKLIEHINKRVSLSDFSAKFKLIPSLNYRSVLIIHSDAKRLSDQISNTHPGYERKKGYVEIPKPLLKEKIFQECKPLDDTDAAIFSATLVNEFTRRSREVLEKHPINLKRMKEGLPIANILLIRGAGTSLPKLENFKIKYRTSWLCIGDTPAEKGIAKLLGMAVLKELPEPLTDSLTKENTENEIEKIMKKDLEVRVKKMLKKIDAYDCIYVHLKGADPFGHGALPKKKKKVIECLDRYFFGKILKKLDLKQTIICVTTDHCTACNIGAHAPDPVPLLISGGNIQTDSVEKFGESYCKKGSIGKIKATNLMSILMGEIK